MYYVYLIQNTLTFKIYIGFTGNLIKRVDEHNTDKVFSTRNKDRWKLIYYEVYRNKEDAKNREYRLKYYGRALAELKKRISRSLLLAN